jgi:hypothetical protein
MRLLLLLCVVAQRRRYEYSKSQVVGKEHSSHFILGPCLRLTLSHIVPGVPAASIVGGMRVLSVHRLAGAACPYRCCIAFPGIPCVGDRSHTTYNGEVACS